MTTSLSDAQTKWCAARLAIFRDFREFPADTKRRYIAKIEKLTAGDRGRLKELVSDIEAAESLPSLAALERMCFARWPLPERADRDCPFCGGTGYEIVERGIQSGARRCRCREAQQVA